MSDRRVSWVVDEYLDIQRRIALARNEAFEQAAKECDREASLWKSSKAPEADDVSGGKSAAFNCSIAIRALKVQP